MHTSHIYTLPTTQILLAAIRYLMQCKQYAMASLIQHQMIREAPSAKLYDYRSLLLSLSGRVEEALTSFAQAQSSEPSDYTAEIYFHRALLYAREAIYEKALLDLARARSLCPDELVYREAVREVNLARAAGGEKGDTCRVSAEGSCAPLHAVRIDVLLFTELFDAMCSFLIWS